MMCRTATDQFTCIIISSMFICGIMLERNSQVGVAIKMQQHKGKSKGKSRLSHKIYYRRSNSKF